jgi:hypothetical protein
VFVQHPKMQRCLRNVQSVFGTFVKSVVIVSADAGFAIRTVPITSSSVAKRISYNVSASAPKAPS